MRRFVVTILVLIGFLNSIAFADGDQSPASTNTQTIESASCPAHSADSPTSDSSHSHQCHVGHCAFVVSESSSFASRPINGLCKSIEDSVYLGSFQSDLFRPPII